MASWLTMTTGRTLPISLSMVGFKSAIWIAYLSGLNVIFLHTVQQGSIEIRPVFTFFGHGPKGVFP